MTGVQRTMARVLSGTSDRNLRFEDLRGLLQALGFIVKYKLAGGMRP